MKLFLSALLLLMSSTLIFPDEIFNSNILGMKLGRISSPDDAGGDFYIRISENKGVVYEHLFKNGSLYYLKKISVKDNIKTVETVKTGETVVEKWENGLLLYEEVRKDGQPSEISNYRYEEGKLKTSDYFIGDEQVFSEQYLYTKDGRLLEINRNYADESNESASFLFSGGLLSRYGFSSGSGNMYASFDKHGIVFSDAYGGGSHNETREYGILDNGNSFELIKNSKSGRESLLVYNKDKRIVSSLIKDSDGKLIEEAEWKYSGDLLTEVKIRNLETVKKFIYEYNPDGELKNELYTENGNIVQITEYESEDTYTEKLYRYGRFIIEIKYKDGVRVHTEQVQD